MRYKTTLVCYLCGRPIVDSNRLRNSRGSFAHATCRLKNGKQNETEEVFEDLRELVVGHKRPKAIEILQDHIKELGISGDKALSYLKYSGIRRKLAESVVD